MLHVYDIHRSRVIYLEEEQHTGEENITVAPQVGGVLGLLWCVVLCVCVCFCFHIGGNGKIIYIISVGVGLRVCWCVGGGVLTREP